MKKSIIPFRYVLVVFTFSMSILMYIDRACISTAKDDICTQFNLDYIQWAWIMAAFTLGYALFQSPAGKLADTKGPRVVLSSIITIWSIFTALTSFAWNFASMAVIRFLFGGGEAGAFPTLSKVVYKWFPVSERGTIQGINFSGSRIGGAVAYPIVASLIAWIGWHYSFIVFGIVGVLFALVCWFLFRDSPEESSFVSEEEKAYIIANRQQDSDVKETAVKLSFWELFRNKNMLLAMFQYIGSNFTFYFTLTWMFPYLKESLSGTGTAASFWAMAPLLGGALGNWLSGVWVDRLYATSGNLKLSRRLPAIVGFVLAAAGMILMTMVESDLSKVVYLTIAIFGADMTLSPSWALCIDIR
ncbi:MAG: MFS transporter [Rikenellaceae bacterium]